MRRHHACALGHFGRYLDQPGARAGHLAGLAVETSTKWATARSRLSDGARVVRDPRLWAKPPRMPMGGF